MDRVPIQIVAGLLGSGKTTALRTRLRSLSANTRIALVLNDFGTVGVDAKLLGREAPQHVLIHAVAGGCICCDSRTQLVLALLNILETEAPDEIWIEPSGLAKLSDVKATLREPSIRDRTIFQSTVTLVNLEMWAREKESGWSLFDDQINAADSLVGSFSDQVDAETTRSFHDWAETKGFPAPHVLTSESSNIPAHFWTLSARPHLSKPQLTPLSKRGHAPAHRLRSFGRTWKDIFVWSRLSERLKAWTTETDRPVRAKGIFQTERGPWEFQLANGDTPTPRLSWTEAVGQNENVSYLEWITDTTSRWDEITTHQYLVTSTLS